MDDKEKIEIICQGNPADFRLFLQYIRRVLRPIHKDKNYFLTYKYHGFDLVVNKRNCVDLLLYMVKTDFRIKENKDALINLLDILNLLPNKKK